MHPDLYSEKNDFFAIITASLIFHSIVIAALVAAVLLKPPKEEPQPIPFFEMINMAPPPPAPTPVSKPKPAPVSRPEPEPVTKPELKPELKPEPKPELKHEPKPEPKPKPLPTPEPPSSAPEEPASMDMPMDLPSDIKSKNYDKDMDMPALQAVGVRMDSELQDYLNRVYTLIYQNFNPPSGTGIAKGTKSSVHFKIARNGEISAVVLRSSSGNSVWDQQAMRAVRITKNAPPLPHSYDAESLLLNFDFREK
ncbi:MAG: TonB family protein [Candidatus Fibromonas sp.]|jgi:protein TonB|nr:TonB family protein [Candidatus Fibromonas sp.]